MGVAVTNLGGDLSGTIANDGSITIDASGPKARAIGVQLTANAYTGSVVNKGNLDVVGMGAVAPQATAIRVLATGEAGGEVKGTITNDGGTIVAETITNGVVAHGVAIDVSNAPNEVDINLEGTAQKGSIWGNIIDTASDTITVEHGQTAFDGVINSAESPVGALVVAADGTFELARNLGPTAVTAAYVNTYNQAGTLQLDVDPRAASAQSISANAATLSGAATLNLTPALYAKSVTYQVVFSTASPLSGKWSGVSIIGGTPLLSAAAVYSSNEADITLTRNAFGAAPGLTPNETAVAKAIGTAYGDSGSNLTGPFATLVGDLFLLNPQQYNAALNALANQEDGELELATAGSAQVLIDTIGFRLNGIGGDHGTAFNTGPAATVKEAQLGNMGFDLWGGGYGNWLRANDTISGPRFTANEGGFIAGADLPVTTQVTVGGALSYGHGVFNADDKASRGDYRGLQGALYGRLDCPDAPWYGLASVTYGSFANKSARMITIPFFGSGVVKGSFHSDVWSAYGEAGYGLGEVPHLGFNLTPYVALEAIQGSSNAYDQTGGPITLSVSGTSARTFSSYVGASFTSDAFLGTTTVIPHLKAAWQHDFNDNPWVLNAAFAGTPLSGFQVTGAALGKDHADVEAGVSTKLHQNIDAMLDYEGRFATNRTESSLVGRIKIDF
jgi:uncharacterized protein with beta-barrel porin domain